MFSKFNMIKVEDVYIHCLGLDVKSQEEEKQSSVSAYLGDSGC